MPRTNLSRYTLIDGTKSIPLNAFPEEAWVTIDEHKNGGTGEVGKMYDAVGFLARCVEIRANGLVALPWSIKRLNNDKEIWEVGEMPPPELEFLEDLDTMLWLTEAALCLVSQAFWNKQGNAAGTKIDELRWLHPGTIKPVWDKEEGLIGFTRSLDKREIQFTPEEIVYFSLVNPLHETVPRKSPAETALAEAGVIFNLNQFIKHFFERGAVKATLLTVPTATTPQQRKDLKTWWQRFTSGVKDAFETGVISTDVKPIVIGDGMKEIENGALTTEKKESIATSLGIPHSIVMSNSANYATSNQDEANFFSWTLLPDARLIAKAINKQLLNDMGMHFQFNPEEHPAFQKDESERAGAVKSYVDAGMKLSVAVQILGVDLPEGVKPEDLDQPEPQPQSSTPAGASQGTPNAQAIGSTSAAATTPQNTPGAPSDAVTAEARKFRNWVKNRIDRVLINVSDFESELLTHEDKSVLLDEVLKGGPGSGNWMHAGRPGMRGGSMGGGGHAALLDAYGYAPRGAATATMAAPPEPPKPKVNLDYRPAQSRVLDLQDKVVRSLQQNGFTEQDGLKAMQRLAEEGTPTIRVSSTTLGKIVTEGRFKTQFETKSSKGMYDPSTRAEAEGYGLGAPKTLVPEKRPVYGYMEYRGKPEGVEKQYGDIRVVLNDSVKERATMTMGDSLGLFLRGYAVGTPVADPHLEAVGQYSGLTKNPLSPTRDLARSVPYVELQLQGGIKVGDIKHVVDSDGKLSASTRNKLEKAGIPVLTTFEHKSFSIKAALPVEGDAKQQLRMPIEAKYAKQLEQALAADFDLIWNEIQAKLEAKGGPGSGNWAHAGRRGTVGGSLPGGGHSQLLSQYGMHARGDAPDSYYDRGKRPAAAPKAPAAAKPAEWRPSMTRKEADAWAAGSAIPQDVYHVTDSNNVDPISAKGFEEWLKGFDLSKSKFGRVWGDGVYMTDDQKTANMYKSWVGGWGRSRSKPSASQLTLRARVNNVFTFDLKKEPGSYKLDVLTSAMRTKPEIVGKQDLFQFMDSHGGFEKAMQALGYDALHIIAPRSDDVGSGGHQFVIFDPKNVVVVQGETK